MKRGTERILTSYTVSLPRPADLVDMVLRSEDKHPIDQEAFAIRVRSAVAEGERSSWPRLVALQAA